ncbi:MAG: hypothetical protein ACLSBH_21150 [Coprobacillus cateniformis]
MIKEVKLNSIILGDAYEVIKKIDSKSIDLIVTDPPYLISKGSSGNGRISKQMLKLTNELQDSDVANGIKLDILDEFMRIMKNQIYTYGVIRNKFYHTWTHFVGIQAKCSFEITYMD